MTSKVRLGLIAVIIGLVAFISLNSLGIEIPFITGKATTKASENQNMTALRNNCKTACQARVLSGFEKVDEEGNCYCKMRDLVPTRTTNDQGRSVNITVITTKIVNIGKVINVSITTTSYLRRALQQGASIESILQGGTRTAGQTEPTGTTNK